MPSSPQNVGEGFTFSGSPSATFVRSYARSSGQMLPRYRMNGLRNIDETYREYSLAPIDDLIRFRRLKIKVIAGRVAKASSSTGL